MKLLISLSILAYIGWGLLLSLQPPFYPLEAELKGATPSQYGFVFGIPFDIIFPIVKIVLFVHWQCAIFLKTMGKTRGSSLDKTDSQLAINLLRK